MINLIVYWNYQLKINEKIFIVKTLSFYSDRVYTKGT